MTILRQRMSEDMQIRNLSPNTQLAYIQQVSLFARYFSKSPELLGPEEIRTYQLYLTNEKMLDPSSIIIAVAALRFLYQVTLHRNWTFEKIIPAPKKPQKLPAISNNFNQSQNRVLNNQIKNCFFRNGKLFYIFLYVST